jgi:Protein of unknown function (DUF3237)
MTDGKVVMMKRMFLFAVWAIFVFCTAATPTGAQRASSGAVLVPHESWTCGMPEGIPVPESGTLLFEAQMDLADVHDVGRTPYGDRQVAVVREGVLTGDRLSGSVTPGALDFELGLSNGVIEIEQILVLETRGGQYIYLRAAGTGRDADDVRIVFDFEAPNESEFAWLNSGRYVGRRILDRIAGTMTLRVYDTSEVTIAPDSGNAVRIEKPAGVPAQPWDYRRADPPEVRGDELIAESVTLSPSLTVGPSKRGSRNIIPITGGELTGRISGRVLMGGADYQNLSPPATIDARYLWQTDDGEVIIVRNAGAFGSLVPTFETRTDGPYAWLNTGTYLSSNPGMQPGGVGITMYESTR